jgi:phosphoribosylamine---glycine ligase
VKVLLIGGGGREHALAWKLAQSPLLDRLYCAPGNAGIAEVAECIALEVADHAAVIRFCKENGIGLAVIGPEAPLVAGLADDLEAAGIKVFGPSKQAAQLEGSKGFTKDLCAEYGIPTAAYRRFTDSTSARPYVEAQSLPMVIKADGLAAGKGVVVAASVAEAHAAIDQIMTERSLGDAGARVVVEQFLEGEEASFIVLSDGTHALALATSQDHKRLRDGDTGPNTGGMGAYSPAPVVTPKIHARVMREIILPTIQGMAHEGTPYVGFLYAGLMIDKSGNPRTLEYNCRLGDPETQPIILRLKSDLLDLVDHALDGTLHQAEPQWDRRAALGVVVAAAGYPEEPRKGDAISGLPKPTADCRVFHAGTRLEGKTLLTNGGRVLCVTALGDSVKMARTRAYDALDAIRFEGMQYRKDIAHRAIKK